MESKAPGRRGLTLGLMLVGTAMLIAVAAPFLARPWRGLGTTGPARDAAAAEAGSPADCGPDAR